MVGVIVAGAAVALVACTACAAQTRVPGEDAVDRALERMLDELVSDEGESDHDVEELLWLHEHPLDLREVDADELARLPGIDIQTAMRVVDAVRHIAPRDLRELAATTALTSEQLLALRAFTTLAVDRSHGATSASARARVDRDLVVRRGYRDTVDAGPAYRGAPEGIVLQLQLARGAVSFASTLASDRGEPLLDRAGSGDSLDAPRVTAFIGASLAWSTPHLTIVVGDFTADFGQGLALSDGRRRFARGASPYVAARHVTPSRSSDESAFLRGFAAETMIERPLPFRARLSAATSWRWLDASIDSGTVTSQRRDGNRRTASEIRRSSNALERLSAFNLTADHERWSLGATLVGSSLRADGSSIETRSTAIALDARLSTRRTTVYAECASQRGSLSVVGGAFHRVGSTTCIVAGRWLADQDVHAHGRAFPRSGPPGAERGVYASVETTLAPALGVAVALDIFQRPVPSSTVPFPASGSDARLRVRWSPLARLELDGRLERSSTTDGITFEDAVGRELRGVDPVDRMRASVGVRREWDDVTVRGRLELRTSSDVAGAHRGWMTALDAHVRTSERVELRAALALFDADDSDVASTIAEADVPGRVRSVRLAGRGHRLSASVRWRPEEWIRFGLAVGETRYRDRRSSGTGLDEIDGPRVATLAIQVDVSFPPR